MKRALILLAGSLLLSLPLYSANLSNKELETLHTSLEQAIQTLDVLPSLDPEVLYPMEKKLRSDSSRYRELLDQARNTSERWDVRVAAIYALRNYLGNPDVRNALMDLAKEDYTIQVRMMSLRVLGRATYDTKVKDFLKDRLRSDYNEGPRIEAIRALGWIKGFGDVYQFLLSQFSSLWGDTYKIALTKSLYHAVLEDHEPAVRKLNELRKDFNPLVRIAAIETLSQDPWAFAQWICPDNPWECAPRSVLPLLDLNLKIQSHSRESQSSGPCTSKGGNPVPLFPN